jgi:hypothetical protein
MTLVPRCATAMMEGDDGRYEFESLFELAQHEETSKSEYIHPRTQ